MAFWGSRNENTERNAMVLYCGGMVAFPTGTGILTQMIHKLRARLQ